MLDISTEAVRLWCAGYARPDLEKITKIADCFNTTCDFLLRDVKSENVDIHKQLGLSDKAIDTLKWLSAEYAEPPNLNEIDNKHKELKKYYKLLKAGLSGQKIPPTLTKEDYDLRAERALNKANKTILKNIDLLLSRAGGFEIIYSIANYFDVDPYFVTRSEEDENGASYVLSDSELSGMHVYSIICAMQKLRNDIRKEREHNGEHNDANE